MLPGFLDSLGMMQRTKWGWVLRRFAISLFRFSCIEIQNRTRAADLLVKTTRWWRAPEVRLIVEYCFMLYCSDPVQRCTNSPAGLDSPCVTVKLSGRKLLSSSSAWFQPLGSRLKQQHKVSSHSVTTLHPLKCLFSRLSDIGCLCSYPSQRWCSSQTVQPSVCWRISGTEPPPSHSEDLCSYPASRWCCTAPEGL